MLIEPEYDSSNDQKLKNEKKTIPIHQQYFSPYQGREYSQEEIESAVFDYEPWLTVSKIKNNEELIKFASNDLNNGNVIAWFQGRSEFGQRALGARSILASPISAYTRTIINKDVKKREWYRPLAPSVLEEFVSDWFIDMNNNDNSSPFMSITATIKSDKVELCLFFISYYL